MIKSVTVVNYLGDSMKIELERPRTSGFAVAYIDGLGPGKANINTSEVATNDGGIFNSSRLSSRNIVLGLLYSWEGSESIEELRLKTYRYFPIKKKVKLIIETDVRTAEIEGYVESNEPNIFSKSQGSHISIICPNPLFYSSGEKGTNVTTFHGITPMFEFPFSNESLKNPLIEMGDIELQVMKTVLYDGDEELGIVITIHALGDAKNIDIYNTTTREMMSINTDKLKEYTGHEMITGDDIVISTVKGDKYIRLLRDGQSVNILNCLEKESDWFQLVKGDNVFAYTAEHGGSNLQFKIENRIAYEGV